MDVKEEDSLSIDVALQNENELFIKKTNSDAVLLKTDNDVMIKTEIKSESPFPDCSSQTERECFSNPLIDQSNFETFSCSSNCKTEFKNEIGFENEREFLLENIVVKDNSNNEILNKIEVKEETWWQNIETSSVYDINDGAFTPVKSPRLYIESVSGVSSSDSLLPSSEALMRNTSSSSGKEYQGSDVSETPAVEKHVHPEQSHTYSPGEIFRRTLLFHKVSYKCNNCDTTFSQLSNLISHNCEARKSYMCQTCERNFSSSSNLKRHNLVHNGTKPHTCEICYKRFAYLHDMKLHTFIHEGEKLHKCEICEKNFALLSRLRTHSLLHDGKKPHKCDICNKRFTQLSHLKRHNLIHHSKKPQV